VFDYFVANVDFVLNNTLRPNRQTSETISHVSIVNAG